MHQFFDKSLFGRHRCRQYARAGKSPSDPLRVCAAIALSAMLNTPLQANDMANLMRGMFTGLALLGQASNTSGLGPAYPGLWYPPLGASAFNPWGLSPLGGYPIPPPQGIAPGSGAPWTRVQPGFPGVAVHPNAYGQAANPAVMRMLQGTWETHNGGLLLVKGNMARLYVSRDKHQDLEINADRRYVWMRPAGTRQAPDRYEYRVYEKQVILRDRNNRTLSLHRHQPSK